MRRVATSFVLLLALVSAARAATTTFSTRPGVVKPATPSAADTAKPAPPAPVATRADSARADSARAAAAAAAKRAPAPSAPAPVAPATKPAAAPVPVPTAPTAVAKPPVSLPTPTVAGKPSTPAPVAATPVSPVAKPAAVRAPETNAPATAAPTASAAPTGPATAGTASAAPATDAPKPAAAMLAARPAGTPGATRITYVAGTTAYLDAGRLEGLEAGDSVTVTRDGATVTRLRVAVVSSHRAACDTLSASAPELRVGDAVRFTPRALAKASGDSTGPVAARTSRRTSASRLRGRLGGRWQMVRTDPGDGSGVFSMSQPSLDLRVDGTNLAGSTMDLAVDVRTRSTRRTALGNTETDSYSRVYRASYAVHDSRSRKRLTLGRQSSAVLSTISLFDGALAEYTGDRVSVGAFSGTQPEPMHMTFSGDVLEHGAYVELHQKPQQQRRWSAAVGAVTSMHTGQANRDFLFAQSSWMSKGFMGWLTQEVDWNRGWKRGAGESVLSPTSTFLSMRVPFGERVAVNSGFDNRRNVRLYRDRETPETSFDDHYRQGAWAGLSVQPASKLRVSGELRRNDGSESDRATSWSASAEAWRLTALQLTLRARTSRYDGSTQDSQLHSFGIGLDPHPGWHSELGGGLRMTDDALSLGTEREGWESASLDVSLARRWYANASVEHNHGDAGTTWQPFAGLSVRF